jgi:hypothetical protein
MFFPTVLASKSEPMCCHLALLALFSLMPHIVSVRYPMTSFIHDIGCLGGNRISTEHHYLQYSNGLQRSVRVPYPNWSSAKISSEIAYSILSEVMNYSTELIDTRTLLSAHPVNYVAGCIDPDDAHCIERNVDDPIAHFTIETWRGGMIRWAQLPADVQPTLLGVLDFTLNDQVDRNSQ